MKRFTACMLSVIMLLLVCAPALSAEATTSERKIVESVIDVPVGNKTEVLFVCKSVADEILLKSDAKSIAFMNDNGRNGDIAKNDGISSTALTLYSNERRTDTYYAYANGNLVSTYTVNYYNELAEQDFAVRDAINADVLQIAEESTALSYDAKLDAVESYLWDCPDVENVERTETAVSYTTHAGITSAYTEFGVDTKGSDALNDSGLTYTGYAAQESADTLDESEIVSYSNPNVLVMRPFRNSCTPSGDGFHHDEYRRAATEIANVTGGKVLTFDDKEANPYNLSENLDKVGFLLIDSHGVELPIGGTMQSLIVMENVNNDGISDADWSTGRVVTIIDAFSSNLLGVSGTYIRDNYAQQSRTLNNTICHIGICLGMKYDSIKVPLAEAGARCIIGYDEVVSVQYDVSLLGTITEMLSKTSDVSENRNYTVTEAIEAALDEHGNVDPAQWGAHMLVYGNTEAALVVPDTGVTDFSFVSEENNAIVNNISALPISVFNGDNEAFGFTQEWSSSDNSIVRVLSPQLIQGVSEGSATVTCRISGEGYEIEKSCTVDVEFISAESVNLTVDSNINPGERSAFSCTVYPRNASNRDYELFNTNPGSASVDDSNNTIAAKSPGTTKLYVKAADGSLDAQAIITVSTKKVLENTSYISSEYAYGLYARDLGGMMVGSLSGDCMTVKVTASSFGYINTNTSETNLWRIEPIDDDSFYLKSLRYDKYLTLNDDDDPEFTDAASSIFEFEADLLKVQNASSSKRYICYVNNKGFSFGTKRTALAFDTYRLMEYTNKEHFKEVTFTDGNEEYTQYVSVGGHAQAACPIPVENKTFLGWDKPLANITDDFTTTALYRDGTTDKIVITFMHTDGTVIETQELKKGASIEYPEVESERNGLSFICWSEDSAAAKCNMTVFAMYGLTVIPGDVTGDGTVNTGDAVLILRAAASMLALDNEQNKAADVSGDGVVNTGDAVLILRYSAGIIESF